MNLLSYSKLIGVSRKIISLQSLARIVPVSFLVLFVFSSVSAENYFEFFKEKYFDNLQRWMPRSVDPNSPIIILDIDEKSLAKLGQWPWPRTELARLVDKVRESGATVLGIDILFPESDRLNPTKFSELYSGLSEAAKTEINKIPDNDTLFGNSLSKYAVVLGRSGDNAQSPPDKAVPVTEVLVRTKKDADHPRRFMPRFKSVISNIPGLETAANHIYGGFGLLNVIPDQDGVVRKIPSIFEIEQCGNLINKEQCRFFHPSFVLEIIRINEYRESSNKKPSQKVLIRGGYAGIENIKVSKDREFDVDFSGSIRPWFSVSDSKKYISVSDFLEKDFSKDRLSEKIVLLGTSAVGLKDIKIVPTSNSMPGVEVHAQAIESILKNSLLERPGEVFTYELLGLIVLGVLFLLVFPHFGSVVSFSIFFSVIVLVIGFSFYLFFFHKILFDASLISVFLISLFFIQTSFRYFLEERTKNRTRNAFSKYLSPDMVNIVSEDPSQLRLGGEEKEITLLFCDVRGFTAISEVYDAVGLTKLINRLLTPLTRVILENGGTVDKYMGDCIMAFWNAPLEDPKHVYHACISALEMLAEVETLNAVLQKEAAIEEREYREIKLGFGVNTGTCVVGNMGSDQRFDYSCLGDSVNLAARIEGQSKDYGCKIIISEYTQKRVANLAALELDLLRVKGKTEAVRIFALCGNEGLSKEMEFQKFKEQHNSILHEYRQQNWDCCIHMCEEVRVTSFDWFNMIEGYYDILISRCLAYKKVPPISDKGKWDGVFVANSK
jgi:adenylate cyclase